jgi:GNAT superfamily N-acetyltransferase
MIATPPVLTIRAAIPGDVPALEQLIEASARQLSRGHYTDAQIEAAVTHVFGVDGELIADGTYLVATIDGDLAGCGGWSRRRTLFGGDRFAGRTGGLLDPATDAARIRAFFVAPRHARRGVGRALLAACEDAARTAGFRSLALMATLPGEPFYRAAGYIADPVSIVEVGDVAIPFVLMHKIGGEACDQ